MMMLDLRLMIVNCFYGTSKIGQLRTLMFSPTIRTTFAFDIFDSKLLACNRILVFSACARITGKILPLVMIPPLWQSGQSKWSFLLSMQKDILEQTTIGWSPTHSRIKSRQLLLWFVHAVVHFPTFAHLERGGTAMIFISFPDHPKLWKQETCVNG